MAAPAAPRRSGSHADVAAELESVTKLFDGESSATVAVDDVSLRLHRGEVLGFLGANGAGKSTTMKMLAGTLAPTAGRVRIGGADPRQPATRSSLGYLPGDLTLPPTWTGERALRLFAALRGAEVNTKPWCDRLRYDPTRAIGTLSTGNRRKLGVIQAFMCHPDVLLLDEPTSGLDPFLQHTFDELVDEARERGAAVLLSSHVLPEVERSAERIAVIERGRLVRTTTVSELSARSDTRLEFTTLDPIGPGRLAALGQLDGVIVDRAPTEHTVRITTTRPIQPVLDVLGPAGIARIETHRRGLEELLTIDEGDMRP